MRKILISFVISMLLAAALTGCGNSTEMSSQASSEITAGASTSSSTSSGESGTLSDTEIADTAEVIAALTALPNRTQGSENNQKAAEWIAGQFELLKLAPLLKEDYFWTYSQSVGGKEIMLQNVVGYIKGSDATQSIVISCHFDSVSGSTGAVDNASGVAAMLRTAEGILAAEDTLNADIIFCAFNGEEDNYTGSRAFVEEFEGLYETVSNINFDCVGVINGGSYMFGAEQSEVGYALNNAMRPYLEKYKIDCGSYPISGVRSDHISFENAKIPNINFTQIGIQSVTHSSSDQADKLDAHQIDLLAACVTEYLLND